MTFAGDIAALLDTTRLLSERAKAEARPGVRGLVASALALAAEDVANALGCEVGDEVMGPEPCPRCGGTKTTAGDPCPACGGEGLARASAT